MKISPEFAEFLRLNASMEAYLARVADEIVKHEAEQLDAAIMNDAARWPSRVPDTLREMMEENDD